MTNPRKKVLITSNGDDISLNIAYHLAKQGCRLVLMGNEGILKKFADGVLSSVEGVERVDVVGMDMEEDKETIFDQAVENACTVLGKLDAFVHCYTYSGKVSNSSLLTWLRKAGNAQYEPFTFLRTLR